MNGRERARTCKMSTLSRGPRRPAELLKAQLAQQPQKRSSRRGLAWTQTWLLHRHQRELRVRASRRLVVGPFSPCSRPPPPVLRVCTHNGARARRHRLGCAPALRRRAPWTSHALLCERAPRPSALALRLTSAAAQAPTASRAVWWRSTWPSTTLVQMRPPRFARRAPQAAPARPRSTRGAHNTLCDCGSRLTARAAACAAQKHARRAHYALRLRLAPYGSR